MTTHREYVIQRLRLILKYANLAWMEREAIKEAVVELGGDLDDEQ